jgi:hypothetical protein
MSPGVQPAPPDVRVRLTARGGCATRNAPGFVAAATGCSFCASPRAGMTPQAGGRIRLWSVHPKYLDARGLVALWREALLAQAVLSGRTRGYRHHPQLHRFRGHSGPRGAIAEDLRGVHAEAMSRGMGR